jgi:hypothetical protein
MPSIGSKEWQHVGFKEARLITAEVAAVMPAPLHDRVPGMLAELGIEGSVAGGVTNRYEAALPCGGVAGALGRPKHAHP